MRFARVLIITCSFLQDAIMRDTARVVDTDSTMQRRSKRFPEAGVVLEAAASAVTNGVSDLEITCLIIPHFLRDSDHGTPPIPIIPHLLLIIRTKSPYYKIRCSAVTQVAFPIRLMYHVDFRNSSQTNCRIFFNQIMQISTLPFYKYF